MDGKVTPKRMPGPRTALGYDGTDFHAVKTDADGRPIVRGEDQLHSFDEPLHVANYGKITAANGSRDSLGPGAGVVWVVTRIVAYDDTSPTTRHQYWVYRNATGYPYHAEIAEFAAAQWSEDSTWLHLVQGDLVRVYLAGGAANDDCNVVLHGHIMTKEV